MMDHFINNIKTARSDWVGNMFCPAGMGRVITCLFFFFFTSVNAQVAPIENTPANGSNWTLLGPNRLPEAGKGMRFRHLGTGAQMRVMFQDADQPNPKILVACTPTGGLFRTMDVTAEVPVWENLTDSTRLPVLGVRDVAFVPGDSQVMYIGAGIRYPLDLRRLYGIGVLNSTDNGRSWQKTGLQFTPPGKREQVCHDLLVDPENPNIVHALCGPNYYRSDDAGTTFVLKKTHELKSPAGWGASFRDIVFKPDNSQVIYLSSDGSLFYLSENGGDSWQVTDVKDLGVTEDVLRMDVAVSALDSQLVYLACATKRSGVILRSLNAGKDWEIVFDKRIRTSYERNDIVVSPNDVNVIYAGGIYLDRIVLDSTKSNSKTISSGTHADHRGVLAISDGHGGDLVFSANDGGLYRGHLPEGKKRWVWEDVSGIGMNNTQFYGIGVAEDYSVILGGTQDNGVLVRDSSGRFFKPRLGGDGSDCAVDHFDSKLVYGTKWDLVAPQVWLSGDGANSFKKILKKGIVDNADTYYLPIESQEDGSIYFGTRNVYKLPRDSTEWQPVGELNLSTKLSYRLLSIAVCATDPNVIYTIGDLLYKTTNALSDSVTWQRISDGMGPASRPYGAGGEMSAVTMDPQNPERVWVSVRNYDKKNKVYFSPDGGGSWKIVSKGLPPFPVNDIAFQSGTADAVYVGTDVGVFFNPTASDPEAEWLPFNSGLPVCLVTDLEMNYCFNKIVIGTFGRSIWESPFAVPSEFPPVEIKDDQTLDTKIFRSDITVGRGATLTLKGEIRFATGKSILLKRNSHLVLDGATVKALCGNEWGGVIIEDDVNFFQRLFGARKGVVEMKNNSSILQTP